MIFSLAILPVSKHYTGDKVGSRMAARYGSLSEYVPSQETWAEYVERLELYFTANEITEATKKRAILLNACGPATYKLFHNLAAPEKPSELPYDSLK